MDAEIRKDSPEFQEMLTEQRREFYMPIFLQDIGRMNAMYELPQVDGILAVVERLPKFKSILEEECKEIDDTIELSLGATNVEDVRIQMADLLGDIIVYCASEARRWNIPIDRVLSVIMDSNFSKLGADGKPIKDERGKFLKGPNYWKPEPKIAQLLLEYKGEQA